MRPRVLTGAILTWAGTAAILFAAVMGLCTAVPRIMGLEPYAVVSGSMSPAIPVGAMVYVRPCEAAYLEPGAAAAFFDRSGNVVVHRVVSNDAETGEIVTKGDANDMPDPVPVPYIHVIGAVTGHVPFLGFPAMAGRFWICVAAVAGGVARAAGSWLRRPGLV